MNLETITIRLEPTTRPRGAPSEAFDPPPERFFIGDDVEERHFERQKESKCTRFKRLICLTIYM